MNFWTSESAFFATWLHRQKPADILPTQVGSTVNILDLLDNGDLIAVMFNASGNLAHRALDILKHRYKDEQYWLNEMNRDQYPEQENETTDWG